MLTVTLHELLICYVPEFHVQLNVTNLVPTAPKGGCYVREIGFGRGIGVAATLISSDKLAWAEP